MVDGGNQARRILFRADRDAQIGAVRGLLKCRTSTARSRNSAASSDRLIRVPGEDEIRAGRQDDEAAFDQRLCHCLAARDAGAAFHKIGLVPHGCRRTRLGDGPERIGIEAVLHPRQSLDQSRIAERVADAEARETARLRHSADDQQIGTVGDRRHRALATEIDIGLVDQDRDVRVCTSSSRSISVRGSAIPVGALGLGK